jgi:hypothetical protein
MNQYISRIENDVQDRDSAAWKALCHYIDELADSEGEEFSPRDAIGPDLFAEISTLPESIAKLKHVSKVWLYGSKLKRIPPEIGEMTSLKFLDVYTSYGLHWFPYELMHCQNLTSSRISTRALYGNYKNRMPFPALTRNPVHYHGNPLRCSICRCEIGYQETNQLWISLKVGTDVVPLLVNTCSTKCESRLPNPHPNYVQQAHKGGSSLKQPPDYYEAMELEIQQRRLNKIVHDQSPPQTQVAPTSTGSLTSDLKPLKVIWKIWEK